MKFNLCLLSFVFIFLIGCATLFSPKIPKESVMLSEELTNMIASARDSHLAIIEEYFNERRLQVDKFIDKEWAQDYMTDFVKTSGVLMDIENAKSQEEKIKILNEFSETASNEIYKRRTSMIDTLNKIEKRLIEEIKEHYSKMLMANHSLTAHLRSVAKVTATRDELMKNLLKSPEEIIPLDKIKSQISPIINFRGKIEELNSFVDRIDTIIKEGKKKDE